MDVVEKTDDSLSDDDEEEESGKEGSRPLYNDQDAMEAKLKQFKSELDWNEHLDVVTNLKELPKLQENDGQSGMQTDIQDDFKREMLFYCQAQVAAKEALTKLRNLGIQTERPEDYFAEMVKSDSHMQKIRQKLLDRKESMNKSERAKRQRQLKKIGKQVQQEVLQKRQQEKKKMLQAVDKIKKGKDKLERPSKQGGDIFDVSVENKRTTNMKRKRKDEKFGYGGKKRKMKRNSAEGMDEAMASFKPNIHGKSKHVNKQRFGNKNSKSKAKRLGRSRRIKSGGKKK